VTKRAARPVRRGVAGLVLHRAALYDLTIALFTLGRERAFRERILGLAGLAPGESVLDVGCGTGTLALAAKCQVGPRGMVAGIDASPEMIARADKKARKARIDVAFGNAPAQALPFPDAQFDAVLATIMFHHLPQTSRRQCAGEMRRVVKPGGRVLAVDFAKGARNQHGLLAHFHRHGHVDIGDLAAILSNAGLEIVASGAVGANDLQFVLGKRSNA